MIPRIPYARFRSTSFRCFVAEVAEAEDSGLFGLHRPAFVLGE